MNLKEKQVAKIVEAHAALAAGNLWLARAILKALMKGDRVVVRASTFTIPVLKKRPWFNALSIPITFTKGTDK